MRSGSANMMTKVHGRVLSSSLLLILWMLLLNIRHCQANLPSPHGYSSSRSSSGSPEALFLLGGCLGRRNDERTTLNVFDGKTWSTGPPAPTCRTQFGFAIYNSMLFLVGGDNGTSDGSVFTFDGASWATQTPMQTARRCLAVTTFRDKLYAIGGMFDSSPSVRNTVLASVEAFDGPTRWTRVPSMSWPRARFAAVAFRGKLFAIGGYNGLEQLETVEAFNGDRWQVVPRMPSERDGLGAVVFGDAIHVVGGKQDIIDLEVVSDTDCFDGERWQRCQPLQKARYDHALVVFQKRIWAVGGFSVGTFNDQQDYARADTEVFDGNRWNQYPPTRTSPAHHMFLGAAVGKLQRQPPL